VKTFTPPYTRYLVSPPRAKRAQYVYRPVVPVTLSFGKRAIRFDALVDSGTDQCTFPGWIVRRLGKDLYKGKERLFSGIGGSVLAYLHRSRLEFHGVKFTANVFYSHAWDDMPFGLLGQASFFAHFDVKFSYSDKAIHFSYR
jgi:hypothetical protein